MILNFLPVGGGGGQQNSLSFLRILARDDERRRGARAVVRQDSKLHQLCEDVGVEAIPVHNSPPARLRFELTCKKLFPKGETCFTFFGNPLLSTRDHLLNVCGCALSNLFHPEIRFWGHLPFLRRTWKEFKEVLRRTPVTWADYWIFETPLLGRRAIELRKFPAGRVGVVRMAASSLVSPDKVQSELAEEFKRRMKPGFRCLFLSTAHPNKRLHLFPAIVQHLRQLGVSDVSAVTTMDENSEGGRRVVGEFRSRGLQDHLTNIGPVSPDQVATLIHCCNAICCFSILESFSNNFVEAWRMEKAMIVTDDSWSRDACGEGALYVEPERPEASAERIARLVRDEAFWKELISAGTQQLATYPTAEEKNQLYYREIEKAVELGPCPNELRKQIDWTATQGAL
jgi:glycosyltransferase involved in cell wall biosynthesis